MNVNDKIVETCKEIGIEVAPDIYKGNATTWVTFNYVSEQPELCTDNTTQNDRAQLYVHLFTPIYENYMDLKHELRDKLEAKGFCVYNIQSYSEGDTIRHTVLETEIIQERNEK